MKKRLLGFILTITLTASIFVTYTPAAQAAINGPFTAGSIQWKVDTDTRELTILGSGAIPNYGNGGAPWYGYRTMVERVILENAVTQIGNWAFADFLELEEVEISGTITRIGDSAFSGCRELVGFVDGTGADKTLNGLTTIGANAFNACSSLQSILMPDITSIGTTAFNECGALDIIVANSARFAVQAGVLVEGSGSPLKPTRIIKSRVSLAGDYIVPDTVTTIEAGAFAGCVDLVRVDMPASVTVIRDKAFYGCEKLELAAFQGNAPTTSNFGANVFGRVHNDFVIVFPPQGTGWSSPVWRSYPARVSSPSVRLTINEGRDNNMPVTLQAGATLQLSAAVFPSSADQRVSGWDSSDTGVATVSQGGLVRGVTVGRTTITVTAEAGVTDYCIIDVVDRIVPATGVSFNRTSISMTVMETPAPTITALLLPANTTEQTNLRVSSSNSGVAYANRISPLSDEFEIIAVAAGTATITVTHTRTNGTTVSASCTVTVSAAPAFVPVTSVTLSTTTLTMGASFNLKTSSTVRPANATFNGVSANSLDWKYLEDLSTVKGASINEGILYVPWDKTGTIVIEATAARGSSDSDPKWGHLPDIDYIQRFTINVVSFLPVTGITNVPTTAYVGRSIYLGGSVMPSNASYRTITWSLGAQNSADAYLNTANNTLIAQKLGTVEVIATVENGKMGGVAGVLDSYTQTFILLVEPYVTNTLSVLANPGGSVSGSGQFAAGESVTITAWPSSGYVFSGWHSSGEGFFDDSTYATTQFTMPGRSVTVTAYFTYTGVGSGGGTNVVTPTPSHYFTSGNTYTTGSWAYFGHITLRDLRLFSNVALDGRTLTRNGHYRVGSSGGFTEITLENGYLDTLNQGPHTLTVNFSDNVSVTAVFTVYSTTPVSRIFDDVYTTDWYFSNVIYVSDRGWMTSSAAQPRQFRPGAPVTQGEVIDALYRMAGSPSVTSANGNVMQGRAAALQWATSRGIIPIAGQFSLDSPITRQDIALLLSRLAAIQNLRCPATRSSPNFSDEWIIDSSARNAVITLYRAEIINGRTTSEFAPLGLATRAEFAAILNRFAVTAVR